MATFSQDPGEWERLDWQLLQNSPVALYFSHTILANDVTWFSAEGYRVATLRVTERFSLEGLLVALGELLAFPDYFGRNLNAFNDCLGDVAIPEVGGLLLVLEDFGPFAAGFPREAHEVLDICAVQSRRFLLTGRRFVVLVQTDDPWATFEPVGACPVLWNPQEWLNAKRGL